jgi:molybdopterin-guanine dinucleotide biosynthesis protein A
MDRSAVILAGGRGRRMGGVNKALLTRDGEIFLVRQARACFGWTDEVLLAGGDPLFAAAQDEALGLKPVPDLYAEAGPLAGLHAGFSAASHSYIWLLACDQPLASADAASLLYRLLVASPTDAAAIPVIAGKPQPLHGVFRRETVKQAGELLQRGERKLLALLDAIPWIAVPGEVFAGIGVSLDFSFDVDTPEDYRRMKKRNDKLETTDGGWKETETDD